MPNAGGDPAGSKLEPPLASDSTTIFRPRPAPVAAPLLQPEPEDQKRTGRIVAATMIGLLVVIIGIVGALLLTGGNGNKVDAAAPKAKHKTSTTTTTRRPTTTTVDPAVVKAAQDYAAYMQRIENIVQQSTAGRGQVGTVVAGVEACTLSPEAASEQIHSVVDNRTSTLNQLAGLGTAPNPAAANIASLLQQSLQSSIQADIHYKGWMDYLYTNYYYEFPVGCLGQNAPTDSEYAAARVADGNSSRLKQQFVDAFNPVASSMGLATWQANSF